MCRGTSDEQSHCISKDRCKETEMFPSNDLVMAAEIDYRRERLMEAARPRRRFRRIRFRKVGEAALSRSRHYVKAA
jgi:hypothetical protein